MNIDLRNCTGYWMFNPHNENVLLKAEYSANDGLLLYSKDSYYGYMKKSKLVDQEYHLSIIDNIYVFYTNIDYPKKQFIILNNQIFVIQKENATFIFCREGLAEVVAYQWAMENNISNNAPYNNDFMQNVLEMLQKESIIKNWMAIIKN